MSDHLQIGRQIYQQRPISLLLFGALTVFIALASWLKSLGLHTEWVYQMEVAVGGDSYLHSLLAFLLTLVLYRVLSATSHTYTVIALTSILITIGCLIDEGMQLLSPLRTFSMADIGSNVIGIAVASLVNVIWLCLRREKYREA